MAHINLGQKEKDGYGEMPVATKSTRNRIIYPRFSVNKELPISSKMLEKTISAKVSLRIKEVDIRVTNGKKKYSCDFEVLSMDLPTKKGKDYSSAESVKKIIEEM